MRLRTIVLVAACLFAPAYGRGQGILRRQELMATTLPPACSAACLLDIIPGICGALTNLTCVCHNPLVLPALEPCAREACNITEALQLEKYAAVTCQTPNDKSHQRLTLNADYVLTPLVVLLVAARLYARIKLDVGLGADDWMMVAALVTHGVDLGTGISIIVAGFGQHTYWLEPSQISRALMFFYLSEIFYLVTITFTKLSLLLFFRRIFPNKRLRILVWVMIGFVITSNLALTLSVIFQCNPISGTWTNWMYKTPPVKCVNTSISVYVAAGMSIFHDVVILLMPIPLLWNLNLTWQKKLNLSVMFSVGSFVILCSCLRLPYLKKLNESLDPAWDEAQIVLWTELEMAVGIICACLPAFRSLIGYTFPSLKMTLGHTNSNAPGYHQSRSLNKSDGKNHSTSHTFTELNDLQESEVDLHHTGPDDERSIATRSEEAPFVSRLVPTLGKGYGNRVRVATGDLEEQRSYTTDQGRNIMMTTTVEQSRN